MRTARKAVLTAAAKKAGWDTRPSPKKSAGSGDIATGRGVGLSTRNGTYVGTVAEVEVNRKTGAVRVTRFVCAHDCGLIINPEALRTTIEANLIQSLGRSLKEEVTFDRSNVTSVDWKTYPVARASDVPGSSRDRSDQPSRTSIQRRGRTLQPRHRRRHRQRDFRRNRRARPPGAAHSRARQSRA